MKIDLLSVIALSVMAIGTFYQIVSDFLKNPKAAYKIPIPFLNGIFFGAFGFYAYQDKKLPIVIMVVIIIISIGYKLSKVDEEKPSPDSSIGA